MATIAGSIKGVSLLSGNVNGEGARKAYIVSVEFPAYSGAADVASVTGVGAAIAAQTRNGKTNTVRGAITLNAGADASSQDVYFTGTAVQALTVSSDDLTGHLAVAAGTEIATTTTAAVGVQLCVVVDES